MGGLQDAKVIRALSLVSTLFSSFSVLGAPRSDSSGMVSGSADQSVTRGI